MSILTTLIHFKNSFNELVVVATPNLRLEQLKEVEQSGVVADPDLN
jgi:hypothetical protein